MNCGSLRLSIELYLTHELTDTEMAAVESHLLECADCAALASQSRAIDALVRRSVEEVSHYPEMLERRVRRAISPAPWLRPAFTIPLAAAACLLVLIGLAAIWAPARQQSGYRLAAAEDFRREIIQNQHREWATTPADIRKVSGRLLPRPELASRLAPAGFHLEKAKICTLRGREFVHLIYAHDAQQISIHVTPASGISRWTSALRKTGSVINAVMLEEATADMSVASVSGPDYFVVVESSDVDSETIAEQTAYTVL